MAADAFSLFESLNVWTDCLAGRPFNWPSPQRRFSSSDNYGPRRSGEAPGWKERLKATQGTARKYTIIRFSADDLDRIRREHSTGSFTANTNEALTAHLFRQFWQSFVEGGAAPRIRVPINMRGIHPKISDRYIGNAIFHAAFLEIDTIDPSSPAALDLPLRNSSRSS
jgi:hypothetical protein